MENQIIINLDEFKGKKVDELFLTVMNKISSIEIAYNVPSRKGGEERWLYTNLLEGERKLAHKFGDFEIREVKIKN